jgi:hypothetical protein
VPAPILFGAVTHGKALVENSASTGQARWLSPSEMNLSMENQMPKKEESLENRIRGHASRRGYRVKKSRQWKHVPNGDNFGDYMLIDTATGFVVLGSRFDASLEDIEAFLQD